MPAAARSTAVTWSAAALASSTSPKCSDVKSVRLEKRVDIVVSLCEWTPDVVEERTGLEENYYEILGLRLPHIELYVRPGRDMARLVEVAALTQALKLMGHDPAKDFNDRLIAYMSTQRNDEPRTTRLDDLHREA